MCECGVVGEGEDKSMHAGKDNIKGDLLEGEDESICAGKGNRRKVGEGEGNGHDA